VYFIPEKVDGVPVFWNKGLQSIYATYGISVSWCGSSIALCTSKR
jgi:hypothetical protein